VVSTNTQDSLDQIFQQAAIQGQTFYAASGDTGAFDCRSIPGLPTSNSLYNQLTVDYPASDPYVTAVGGTALTLGAGSIWQSEVAWSDPNHNPAPPRGTGGGHSIYWAEPAWQTGAGFNDNGGRHVPDVALDADPRTGYSIYTTIQNSTGWYAIGGTSAAAPSWAAFTALYNQYAGARGVAELGFASPTLYDLAAKGGPYPAFHDVTVGDNLNYNAGAGWDYPTGWGTPYVAGLIFDLAGAAAPISRWTGVATQAAASGLQLARRTWFSAHRLR
jgi:kumamolisin